MPEKVGQPAQAEPDFGAEIAEAFGRSHETFPLDGRQWPVLPITLGDIVSMPGLLNRFGTGTDVEALRFAVWFLCQKTDPAITLEQAGQSMKPSGFPVLIHAVNACLTLSGFDAPTGGGKPGPANQRTRFLRFIALIYHHYPGVTEERLLRMSLRQVFGLIEEIQEVNPMCAAPENDGKSTPPGPNNPQPTGLSPRELEHFTKYGGNPHRQGATTPGSLTRR